MDDRKLVLNADDETVVSVIIPVLNGQCFIGRTLDSVLGQTYRALEVIVVDDGSSDSTPDIVEAAAARDAGIRFFRRPHSERAKARNFAVSQARGTLIAPLDADDLWHPEKIARQVEVMQASSPNVGVVYCWSVEIDENDLVAMPLRAHCAAKGNVLEKLVAKGNFLQNASVPLIRRSYFDAVGGYDVTLRPQGAEDWQLNLALAEICEFAVIPAHLVGYRRSSTNMSRNTTEMERSIEQVAHWITAKWPNLPPSAKRQMHHNLNRYLAYQALIGRDFTKAIGYQFRSLKAEPSAVLAAPSFVFAAQFLAHLFGIRRAGMPFQPKRIPFKRFSS